MAVLTIGGFVRVGLPALLSAQLFAPAAHAAVLVEADRGAVVQALAPGFAIDERGSLAAGGERLAALATPAPDTAPAPREVEASERRTSGTGINLSAINVIVDKVAELPEAATWALMMVGMGLVGGMLRRPERVHWSRAGR